MVEKKKKKINVGYLKIKLQNIYLTLKKIYGSIQNDDVYVKLTQTNNSSRQSTQYTPILCLQRATRTI